MLIDIRSVPKTPRLPDAGDCAFSGENARRHGSHRSLQPGFMAWSDVPDGFGDGKAIVDYV